ncbi:bifunctional 5,10-methylenetetrahydrofolate dehydrogenase/5,10-methenyltetrahydrofolate cyclohydrolase [Candidatus Saccharibacteria bacterium]|nr:bifunctional 5,10-methylenetetrahydrofolate dehydrogenase/5,10-methenyltetrahydrofolate cyclohydrolase [Candidatus Saccharibacteria bacterium]
MKELNGRELAGFIKERQAAQVRGMARKPRLLIIRDSDNPVIMKYVKLKIRYGEDIGVGVEDYYARGAEDIVSKVRETDADGVIIQLPLKDKTATDELCNMIPTEKDVDGLGVHASYDSATATAIHWLLTGYDIDLRDKKIAIVGRGKLVGAPLCKMWKDSGYDVTVFHHGDDLARLREYNLIVTATGKAGLITSSMVSPGAVVVDAGTASEDGVLRGDVADEVRARGDLAAITPTVGGVGPMTIACLFDHVITAASR